MAFKRPVLELPVGKGKMQKLPREIPRPLWFRLAQDQKEPQQPLIFKSHNKREVLVHSQLVLRIFKE